MRILLILRGNYHCGQEEWIEKYSLKDYTIDLNHLRFLSSKTKKLANHYEIFEFHNDIKLI
ncbi:serine/threonine protein phosphatase, partial [Campylobacter sp. 2018MI35]|nr:serine/threonine protein phosphatase [Campylobacter sp. 2018MI34]